MSEEISGSQCPQCGFQLSAGDKRCPACGEWVQRVCPECGAWTPRWEERCVRCNSDGHVDDSESYKTIAAVEKEEEKPTLLDRVLNFFSDGEDEEEGEEYSMVEDAGGGSAAVSVELGRAMGSQSVSSVDDDGEEDEELNIPSPWWFFAEALIVIIVYGVQFHWSWWLYLLVILGGSIALCIPGISKLFSLAISAVWGFLFVYFWPWISGKVDLKELSEFNQSVSFAEYWWVGVISFLALLLIHFNAIALRTR